MVALDATACRLTGLDVDKVDYFKAVKEKGLGCFDPAQIEIRGSSIEEVKQKLYLPYLQGFNAWPEYHFHVKMACSTCQGLVAFTMERLKALGAYEKNKGLHIFLGRHSQIPRGVEIGNQLILHGDCTLALKKKIEKSGGACLHVPGCPPLESFPVWTILDRQEQPSDRASRERHAAEDEIFKKWVKSQKRI